MKKRNDIVTVSALRWLVCLGAIAWVGCGENPAAENPAAGDRPIVVTTSTLITDWTEEIGGEAVTVVGLLEPGDDPHVYEPTPQDSVAIEQADLIIYNGYDLEPGLIRMIEAAGGEAVRLPVGEVVTPLDTAKEGQTVPDPHVWGDVNNAKQMAIAIQDHLVDLVPEQQALIQGNGDRYLAELDALDGWIEEQIATIPANQRQLVTTHDAFAYYAQAYGLTVAGTLIGISTEEQPSAQTVQQLVEVVRSAGVPAIFAETTINPELITTVADEAGVILAEQALYADSLGTPDSNGATYIAMMVANTTAIVENLGGRITPFEAIAND